MHTYINFSFFWFVFFLYATSRYKKKKKIEKSSSRVLDGFIVTVQRFLVFPTCFTRRKCSSTPFSLHHHYIIYIYIVDIIYLPSFRSLSPPNIFLCLLFPYYTQHISHKRKLLFLSADAKKKCCDYELESFVKTYSFHQFSIKYKKIAPFNLPQNSKIMNSYNKKKEKKKKKKVCVYKIQSKSSFG